MDNVDKAQYQESLVRDNEIKHMFKKIIYKCESCHDKIEPTSKIRRWCVDCYNDIKNTK